MCPTTILFDIHSERIRLQSYSNHILLKFNRNISITKQESIVNESVGSLVKKRSTMRENYGSGEYSINQIIELKGDADAQTVVKAVLNNKEIEYVGMAFGKNDNVKHFTNGEVVVKFKDFVSSSNIDNINTFFHCTVIDKFDLSPVEKNVYLLALDSRGAIPWSRYLKLQASIPLLRLLNMRNRIL